mgnify:CR=1 FL=1
MEFGVHSGSSTKQLSEIFQTKVYGFDSFLGLPEDDGYFKKGEFNMQGIPPDLGPQVELVVGWFENTLPFFKEQHPDIIKMISIDCDTYIGAKSIFTHLKDRFVSGTTIYFDELREGNNYFGWEVREHRAFLEFIQETRFDYKYLAKAPDGGRVCLILL